MNPSHNWSRQGAKAIKDAERKVSPVSLEHVTHRRHSARQPARVIGPRSFPDHTASPYGFIFLPTALPLTRARI